MQNVFTNAQMLELVQFAARVYVYAKINSSAPVVIQTTKSEIRRVLESNTGCDWYVESNLNGNLYLGSKS